VKKRTALALVSAAAIVVGLAACAPAAGSGDSGDQAGAGGLVGVAMPTKSSERWIADGDNIKKQLEAAGF
jgi:putative multiple sugar transport system substrate-binding protein